MKLLLIVFVILLSITAAVADANDIIRQYSYIDDFGDNSLNTTFLKSYNSSSGVIDEIKTLIEFKGNSSAAAGIIGTNGVYRTYNASVSMRLADANNGFIGIFFQNVTPAIGTNAVVTGNYRGGITYSQALDKLTIAYVNTSGGLVYWDEAGGTWTYTPTGITHIMGETYILNISRFNYYYTFSISDINDVILAQTTPMISKTIRNGEDIFDYVYFGEPTTNLGRFNATFDDFNLNWSDNIIPIGNNHTTDEDAYNRLYNEVCYACWDLISGMDGFYTYGTVNNSYIKGFENAFLFNAPSSPNNADMVAVFYTEDGIHRIPMPSAALSSVSYSLYQPLNISYSTGTYGFKINGTYPNMFTWVNGTDEDGTKIDANISFHAIGEHWFGTDGFYYVTITTFNGTISLNGVSYPVNGSSSFEHGWSETNIIHGTTAGTEEYYQVAAINGYDKGLTIYYRLNPTGSPIIRDGGVFFNGYEWGNFNYTALERMVNGTQQIITRWNVSVVNSSTGMKLNFTGILRAQYGVRRAAGGDYGSSGGIYNITGNYTYPNGTIVNITGESPGYNKVNTDTTNPAWVWTPCVYGCQSSSGIIASNGNISAAWTAFNSSYLIRNVWFTVVLPNATVLTNLPGTLQNGNNQIGLWKAPINTTPTGTYTITTWSNDSRGVWIRTTSSYIVSGAASSGNTEFDFDSSYVPSPMSYKCQNNLIYANFTNYANITTVEAYLYNAGFGVMDNGNQLLGIETVTLNNNGAGKWSGTIPANANRDRGNRAIDFIVTENGTSYTVTSTSTLLFFPDDCTGTGSNFSTQVACPMGTYLCRLWTGEENLLEMSVHPWTDQWGYIFYFIVLAIICMVVYMKNQQVQQPLIIALIGLALMASTAAIPDSYKQPLVMIVGISIGALFYRLYIKRG